MIKKFILILSLFSGTVQSITFNEAVNKIQSHESIESIIEKSKASSEQGDIKGSWGDPLLKISAKNFPKDSLKKNETAMTGIEFGVSQKISLTTKYRNIENSFKALSNAYKYEAEDKKEALIKALWEILILKRKISEELKIFAENHTWITKILKVSKKLYANGKTSQQAILEIQIRISEIEGEQSNRGFELQQLNDKLTYLIGATKIDESSIPWGSLKRKTSNIVDNRELGLKEKLKAKDFSLSASKLNYIPDLTVSLGITKRADIDGNGDFVGASISFPLPFSAEKYSHHDKAVHEKYRAENNFKNYKKAKSRDVLISEKEIMKLETEIKIIRDKTMKFATNSRLITSKSYGLGNSSYIELLQSELKLQKILMHKVMLEAKRDKERTSLKYILGGPLNE